MKIIKPKTDIMLQSSSIIDSFCNDIKKIGITFFSHARIFNDGSRIDLNNHPEMIDEFYFGRDKMYKTYTPEVNPKSLDTNLIFLDSLHDNQSVNFLRNGYSIDHMVVEIEKYQDYCDVWNFGTYPTNNNFYSSFIIHRETIDIFKLYYLDRAQELIKKCEKDPIRIISELPNEFIEPASLLFKNANNSQWNDVKEKLLKEIQNSKSEQNNLTKSERKYSQLLMEGLTRTEIAQIVFRSPKTVDAHIQNVRQKLNCKNMPELLTKLYSMGFRKP